ncbi:MAG: DinB family protein [Bacteroidota bacterium]
MNHWNQQLDQNTAQFVAHFENLSAEELNWKLNPNTWSIAQNIDHLIITNSTYFPVLAALKSGTYQTPFVGKFGFLTSLMGKMVLNASGADRRKKIKTFPIWEPSQGELSGDIVAQFTKHQEKLKQEIETSTHLAASGIVIASPANKNIAYKLSTAFDVIVVHEQRHLEQAKEVLELI